jgi:two-component system, chemotaxis family, chemotaxis protein CheV
VVVDSTEEHRSIHGHRKQGESNAIGSKTMSTTKAVSPADHGILLEAGTNEAEVLAFRVCGARFGVNVAKVREVVPLERLTPIPHSHPAIDGLAEVREMVIPLINLRKFLFNKDDCRAADGTENLLLLEFNNIHTAFRVEEVERIYRVSWKDTRPVPRLGENACPVTSVLRQKEGLLPMLDFESICATVGLGGMAVDLDSINKDQAIDKANLPIVYADDSQLVRAMVKDSLHEAGFHHLRGFPDGQDAWTYLSEVAENSTPESIHQKVACIVTDVEMPRMDGLSLTKKIRQDSVLNHVPVVVFSSIATKDNQKKGIQVGASAQVSKAKYDELVSEVTRLVTMGA